jgi:Tol biopolymer transport system component
LKTVITGQCDTANGPVCSFGASPSFAWSPDGQRLAVAVNRKARSTLLQIVDRTGKVVRRFGLPRRNPERGGQAYHMLVAWSPDGRRVLLVREDEYFDSAVVVLDVSTGALRTLARIEEPHDNPTLSWSPDGKFIAMTSEGRSPKDYAFAVLDASNGKPVVACKVTRKSCRPLTAVWSSDASSLYAEVGGSPDTNWIDRVSISGVERHVLGPERGYLVPWIGLPTGLVYQSSPPTGAASAHDVLYRYDFHTKRRVKLSTTRFGFLKVVPLTALP